MGKKRLPKVGGGEGGDVSNGVSRARRLLAECWTL